MSNVLLFSFLEFVSLTLYHVVELQLLKHVVHLPLSSNQLSFFYQLPTVPFFFVLLYLMGGEAGDEEAGAARAVLFDLAIIPI